MCCATGAVSERRGEAMRIVRDLITLEDLQAMAAMHRELAAGRWFELPLVEQLANIGSEVERTISWRGRNAKNSEKAFERGLELLDLTIADPRHRRRLMQDPIGFLEG